MIPEPAAASSREHPGSFPPGPQLSPEQAAQDFLKQPEQLLLQCQKDYGDVFTLWLDDLGHRTSRPSNGAWVFLARPDLVEALYKAPADVLLGGAGNAAFFGERTQRGGSLRLDGAAHSARQRLLNPLFKGESLAHHLRAMGAAARRVVESWEHGQQIHLLQEMQKITLQVIIETLFGCTDASVLQALSRDLPRIEQAGQSRQQQLDIEERISTLLYAEIRRARLDAGRTRQDVLTRLVRVAVPKVPEPGNAEGEGLTDRELHDELMSLLKAGFGTTANTLAWMIAEILQRPQYEAALRHHLRQVVGARPLDSTACRRLGYVDALTWETLRLHPPAAIGGVRYVAEPYSIEGHDLPVGTLVVNCSYLLHRRADLYRDPLHFRPERFLQSKNYGYGWAGFGGGQRMCTGRAFALQEMKSVLSVIFTDSSPQLSLDPSLEDLESEAQGFFLTPAGGPMVRVRCRSSGVGPGEMCS
jgi:unspecific monooxygenase